MRFVCYPTSFLMSIHHESTTSVTSHYPTIAGVLPAGFSTAMIHFLKPPFPQYYEQVILTDSLALKADLHPLFQRYGKLEPIVQPDGRHARTATQVLICGCVLPQRTALNEH